MYDYEDAKGNLLFYTARYEYENIRSKPQKVVLPLTYCLNKETGKRRWRFRAPDGAYPLFGLRQLYKRPNAHVIVVEGEKKAKAARKICSNYAWVASLGGARSANKSDWSPLEGRNVIIWRDNDKAGLAYQRDVLHQMNHVGAKSAVFIDLPHDLPKGWDVADAVENGWNARRIEGFISKHARKAKSLPTLTMEELDAHHIPDEKTYFPWLCEGHAVILYAKSGLGKTLFALGISAALANGDDFLKWENGMEPVGVLYIDGEMSLVDMRKRLRSLIPSMHTKAPLELLSHQEIWNAEETDMDLAEEKLQERIKKII